MKVGIVASDKFDRELVVQRASDLADCAHDNADAVIARIAAKQCRDQSSDQDVAEGSASLLLTALVTAAHEIGISRELLIKRAAEGFDIMAAKFARAESDARSAIGGVN